MKPLFAFALMAALCCLPMTSVDAQYYGAGYDLYSTDGWGAGYGGGYGYGYGPGYAGYGADVGGLGVGTGVGYTPGYSTYFPDGLYGHYYTSPYWYR